MNGKIKLVSLATGLFSGLSLFAVTATAQQQTIPSLEQFAQQQQVSAFGSQQTGGLPVQQPQVRATTNGQRIDALGTSGIRDFYGDQPNTAQQPIVTQQAGTQEALTIYQPYPVPYGGAALDLNAQQQQQAFAAQPQQQIQYIQPPQYIPQPQYAPQPQIQYIQQPPQRIEVPVPVPFPVPAPAPRVEAPTPEPAYHQPRYAAAPASSGDIINNNYNTIDVRVPQAQAAQPVYYQQAPKQTVYASAPQSKYRSSGCGTVYATDKLNLRTGPGVWYPRICTVPTGYQMKCGGCKGKWCKVGYRGKYYWASRNFLSKSH